jgi:hypothetical protein
VTALAVLLLQEAASFDGLAWVGEKPMLAGRPVLVRWWTQG